MTAHPAFVVAGAARSGTTSIVETLRRHPDAALTVPKEPHYLALGDRAPAFTGPGDELTINRQVVWRRSAYLSLFPDDGRITGEGSVSTLYYAERSSARLLELNPDAKVVVILREPVARAFSSHQYLRNRGFEPEPDFRRAVELEDTRIREGWHHLWHYTSMSRYADSVAVLLDRLGPDQVRVWWYDDLSATPDRCVAEILQFLGLRPLPAPSLRPDRVNVSGSARLPDLQRALQQSYRHPWLRAGVRAVVPFALRERLRRSTLAANTADEVDRADLGPSFTEDLDRLEELLRRAVPPTWRTRQRPTTAAPGSNRWGPA
jgi:hypothetical protein